MRARVCMGRVDYAAVVLRARAVARDRVHRGCDDKNAGFQSEVP